ncbi:MAG: GNAT family N-acetyltransferase [bacterium]|nr:GNAT family N-acetyltransferase [bacterium]
MSSSNPLLIRSAGPADVPAIYAMIRELAEYEKLLHIVEATEDSIHRALFGEKPAAEALIALEMDVPVGFALYFTNFSTFVGKPGLYLEDLYVKPKFRGKGYGKALLVRLANIAVERDYGRMEWSVLDWNTPSIEFYKSLGAVPMDEWTVFRLNREAIASVASSG